MLNNPATPNGCTSLIAIRARDVLPERLYGKLFAHQSNRIAIFFTNPVNEND
ncbi:hypothetical protein NIES4075_11780 [Tolypothrix sp. NIES-4075]|nr:hypothetical protein NIES4075_11780 [Tolypothrix sp. NIES-4075]